MDKLSQKKFLGITTVGEKGQVVIPAEARAVLSLVKGEKLVVMSPHDNAIVLIKASQFEAMAAHFTKNIASVRKMIKRKK
jgi:AbrB family looped-hinge helix DNA binding protein